MRCSRLGWAAAPGIEKAARGNSDDSGKWNAIQYEAKRESDVLKVDGVREGLAVVVATTKIEIRKLSERQDWTRNNGDAGSLR